MKLKEANKTESDLTQRVMGRLNWTLYMRLKTYSKTTKRNVVDDIVPCTILAYLDRAEQEQT
jgi:hypothetical protein